MTNVEIARAIHSLAVERQGDVRTLVEYLRALSSLLARHCDRHGIAADTFVRALREAYNAPDHAVTAVPRALERVRNQGDLASVLARLIRDLERLTEAGVYDNPWRMYGVEGPDGELWVNFEVWSYLTCGCRGALWSEDDPVERLDHLSWDVLHDFLDCGRSYE